ncbi:UDP-glucose dehydrogenase family protein [Oceanisphaera pacifica]|uniref:UDP-glucose 6-dehydrogenase n=1 Tax=Oceanisphaera pacifica TaxID=2818389 RepID=A0ABS3NJG0_9GAMM|nr:UDP-glucose/GDP-mannose dehydrogenase family protein [Oceanisphaera pacifica]MBO1520731.1 UDP-glucose/GDP-mannose dehydrogenase family protein [Oceanisphaera pacifica]
MKITVYGSGYVGLVAAACFADVGHDVLCMDVDTKRIQVLRQGDIPIYEPGLRELVVNNSEAGRLQFSDDVEQAVHFATLQFIAVGTPPDEDGSADLNYVLQVASSIGQHMQTPKVIVNKSTVPVGTADKVSAVVGAQLQSRALDLAFEVCSNPEFMKEGAAIDDFTRGARIVVGTNSNWVKELMRECYAPYNRHRDKLMFMQVRAAELTKYAANAMLATKISFMNEMANLADLLDVDIEEVRQGIGSDPRIGYHFIYPGCGYGGSCFPKDVQAINHTAKQVGYPSQLLQAVESVNQRQKTVLFRKLNQAFDGQLAGKTIAVWGLAFKPNTDDMREAPSRVLMEALWQAGATVQAYDPEAMIECARLYPAQLQTVAKNNHPLLTLSEDKEQAVQQADALVICTEWKEFRTLDFTWLKQQLTSPVLVDGRNLYEPSAASDSGVMYFGIGRTGL